jgi:hypothetical protein
MIIEMTANDDRYEEGTDCKVLFSSKSLLLKFNSEKLFTILTIVDSQKDNLDYSKKIVFHIDQDDLPEFYEFFHCALRSIEVRNDMKED